MAHAPHAAPTTSATSGSRWKKIGLPGWGLILFIVYVVIQKLSVSDIAKHSMSLVDWIPYIVVIGAAIIGLRHSGSGSKWATFLVVVFCIVWIVLGDEIFTIRNDIQASVRSSSSNKPAVEAANPSIRAKPYETVRVELAQIPSSPVQVVGGRCIFFWQFGSSVPTHQTEVQVLGNPEWFKLESFFEMRKEGKVSTISMIRWTGTGTLAYELRPDGQC